MEKKHFIDKLEERKVDLQESKEFWKDKTKEIFTYLFKEDEADGPIDDGAVEYIKQFIDLKDKSVLDVGFGTGRHLKLMADAGAGELYGVEMSEGMVEQARKCFVRGGLDVEKMGLYNLPWEEIDLDKLNWRNKFDLVASSRTPALSSYESVKKLISASKKGIFFMTHVDITEDVLSEVYREIHGKEYNSRKQGFRYLFNILYMDGYLPNVKIEETRQKAEYPTDMLVSRYASWVFPEGPDENELNRLRGAIKKYEVDGKVPIVIIRKAALIYFEKN